LSSLQKLIAENAESAEIFFNKYCSAYSAVSAIKNPFCSEVISFYSCKFVQFVAKKTNCVTPVYYRTTCRKGEIARNRVCPNLATCEITCLCNYSRAGNFLQQELAVMTGAVEAVVVDVQCIFPALADLSACYHTKFISTSPKAKFPGAVHMEFHEETAYETARAIVRAAVENYPNRNRARVFIPDVKSEAVVGFSVEAILAALGGSLDPLLGAVKSGAIRGIVAVVGCNNPKVQHDYGHVNLVRELIRNDVLVVTTGCNAIACAKAGLLLPEAAEQAGDGLKGVCKALGIPPVLHMGSCVDISRILVACAAIANALGVDISDLPVAGAAPEWMSEKAVSIGAYVVASGILTVLGTVPQVLGSPNVAQLLTAGAEGVVGGKFAVEPDPFKAARLILDHIAAKRAALGL
jgi:carbon-monoxide dehydrogenase catalytic subunit